MRKLWGVTLVSLLNISALAKDGDELLGTKAPGWKTKEWFNSKPLTLPELRGKVVLVRWWTGPQCPYCVASAAALNEFYSTYKDQAFIVVGLYHHKSFAPITKKHVKRLIQSFEFEFPVTIDRDWANLQKWWLQKDADKKWTSVSFLLDKEGTIRYIHPDGQYVKGDKDYSELKTHIEKLLKQPI